MSAPDRRVTQSRYVARMGHPALDVRIWCDVCLVLGSDIRHHCIKGVGVAIDIKIWCDVYLILGSDIQHHCIKG